MKSETKMWSMIGLLLIDGIILEIVYPYSVIGSLATGFLLIIGVGFGWYAKCAKIEDEEAKKK